MSIQTLMEHIELLRMLPPQEETPSSEMYLKYCDKLRTDLSKIVQDNGEACWPHLEKYFEENWPKVRGTVLSYTALPFAIKNVLADIVTTICIHKNQNLNQHEQGCAPIQILMPGLCLESMADHYPHLYAFKRPDEALLHFRNHLLSSIQRLNVRDIQFGEIEKAFQAKHQDLVIAIQLLKIGAQEVVKQAKISKEDAYRIVAYFQKKKIDQINNDIKAYDNQKSLMRADLGGGYVAIPLEEVLSSHIEAHDSESLIPVSVIAKQYQMADAAQEYYIRPYQDISQGKISKKDRLIQRQSEERRLYGYSVLTKTIEEDLKKLKQLDATKKISVYEHLVAFCAELRRGGVSHGDGKEGLAGASAHCAMSTLVTFLDSLDVRLELKSSFNPNTPHSHHIYLSIEDINPESGHVVISYHNLNRHLEHPKMTPSKIIPAGVLRHINSDKIKSLCSKNKPEYWARLIFEEIKADKTNIITFLENEKCIRKNCSLKDQFPTSVWDKIQQIIEIVANPLNDGRVATCVEQMNKQLLPLLKAHRIALSGIGCSNEKIREIKQGLLDDIKSNMDLLEKNLKQTHEGNDQLPITIDIIRDYGIGNFSINNEDDFQKLMSLDPSVFKLHCENQGPLKRKLLQYFGTDMSRFILEAHSLSAEKIKMLLEALSPELFDRILPAPYWCTYNQRSYWFNCAKFRSLFQTFEEEEKIRVIFNAISAPNVEEFCSRKDDYKHTFLRFASENNPKLLKVALEELLKQSVANNNERTLMRLITTPNQTGNQTILHVAAAYCPETIQVILELLQHKSPDLVETVAGGGASVIETSSVQKARPFTHVDDAHAQSNVNAVAGGGAASAAIDEPIIQKFSTDILDAFEKLSNDVKEQFMRAIVEQKDVDGRTPMRYLVDRPDIFRQCLMLFPKEKQREMILNVKNPHSKTFLCCLSEQREFDLLDSTLKEFRPDEYYDLLTTEDKSTQMSIINHIACQDNPDMLSFLLKKLSDEDKIRALANAEVHFRHVYRMNIESSETLIAFLLRKPEHIQALKQLLTSTEWETLLQQRDLTGQTVLHRLIQYPESLKVLLNDRDIIHENSLLDILETVNSSGETIFHTSALKSPQALPIIIAALNKEQLTEALRLRTYPVNEWSGKQKTVLACIVDGANNFLAFQELLNAIPRGERLAFLEHKFLFVDEENAALILRHPTNPACLQFILNNLTEEEQQRLSQAKYQGKTLLHWTVRDLNTFKLAFALIPENQRQNLLQQQDEGEGERSLLSYALSNEAATKHILSYYNNNLWSELIRSDQHGKRCIEYALDNPKVLEAVFEHAVFKDNPQKIFELMTTNMRDGVSFIAKLVEKDNLPLFKRALALIPENKRVECLLHRAQGRIDRQCFSTLALIIPLLNADYLAALQEHLSPEALTRVFEEKLDHLDNRALHLILNPDACQTYFEVRPIGAMANAYRQEELCTKLFELFGDKKMKEWFCQRNQPGKTPLSVIDPENVFTAILMRYPPNERLSIVKSCITDLLFKHRCIPSVIKSLKPKEVLEFYDTLALKVNFAQCSSDQTKRFFERLDIGLKNGGDCLNGFEAKRERHQKLLERYEHNKRVLNFFEQSKTEAELEVTLELTASALVNEDLTQEAIVNNLQQYHRFFGRDNHDRDMFSIRNLLLGGAEPEPSSPPLEATLWTGS